MLTKVAPWVAMTNAVSAAATCARAEVPPSSVSGARSASGKSLPDCCAPKKKKLGRYSGALALVLVPRYSILHTTLHYPAAPAVHY